MTSRTVHCGTTRAATQSVGVADTVIVQGGSGGATAGGTAVVAGVFTNAGTIAVLGGAGVTPRISQKAVVCCWSRAR